VQNTTIQSKKMDVPLGHLARSGKHDLGKSK
jgi:hypothetical protein